MSARGFRRESKVVWPGYSETATRQVMRVGRNDACPCASGKKYKDCHAGEGEPYLAKLALDEERRRRLEFLEHGEGRRLPWYKRLLLRFS